MRSTLVLFCLSSLALAGCSRNFEVLWPTGILRMRGAGRPGAEQGPWQFYYPSGQLRERGSYSNGRRVGEWTQWFPGGQRASQGERGGEGASSGQREGEWRFWHENGVLRAHGRFVHGKREGDWSYFDSEGVPDAGRTGRYAADEKL